jgi:hypothetical protein
MTSKVDPLSTRRSALTSAIAISIANLADLPIVELNVNKAPIFTVLGCAMDDVRSVPRRERRKRGEKTKPISQKVKKKRTKTELFSVRKAILESSWNLMVHLD